VTPVNHKMPVDSDWACDHSNRKSITGFTSYTAGGPVVYKTRKQFTVAMSSTETEFVAAADTGRFVLYIRSIFT